MREVGPKQIKHWYERLLDIASETDTNKRYAHLVQLHRETLDFYLPAIQALTEEDASRQSSDGRSVSCVVAHIMAWEDWQVQVFTDSNKDERLRQQMKLKNYFDSEAGKFVDFKDVDDFNAYQAVKYSRWSWADIQQKAVDTALELQSMFPPNPSPEWIDFLESTPIHVWKVLPNRTLTVPAGWYLWMVSLEHEAVEHRKDLSSNHTHR